MTITLENQKKHQAESILAIASEFTKMATQGGHGIRYVSGQNLREIFSNAGVEI